MAYDNNLTGLLSRNERKQQPNHPDFNGSCEIAGIQYWISGWIKEGKPGSKMAGKKFFSLAFKPKEQPATQTSDQNKSAGPDTKPPPKTENLDEDVPF